MGEAKARTVAVGCAPHSKMRKGRPSRRWKRGGNLVDEEAGCYNVGGIPHIPAEGHVQIRKSSPKVGPQLPD